MVTAELSSIFGINNLGEEDNMDGLADEDIDEQYLNALNDSLEKTDAEQAFSEYKVSVPNLNSYFRFFHNVTCFVKFPTFHPFHYYLLVILIFLREIWTPLKKLSQFLSFLTARMKNFLTLIISFRMQGFYSLSLFSLVDSTFPC